MLKQAAGEIAQFLAEQLSQMGGFQGQIVSYPLPASDHWIVAIDFGIGDSNYAFAQRALVRIVSDFGTVGKVSIQRDEAGLFIRKSDCESERTLTAYIAGISKLYPFWAIESFNIVGSGEIPRCLSYVEKCIDFQMCWVGSFFIPIRPFHQYLCIGGFGSLFKAGQLIEKLVLCPSVGEIQLLELATLPVDMKSQLPGKYAVVISPPAQTEGNRD